MKSSPQEALFALTLAKPAERRDAFLNAVCDGDAALPERLDALLAAHEQPETLVATQAEAVRPTIKLDLADAPDEAMGQTLGRYKLLEMSARAGPAWSRSRSKPSRCGGAWRSRSSSLEWTRSRWSRGSRPGRRRWP